MPSSATHSWVQEAQPKGPFFSPKAHRSHDLPLSLENSTLSSLAPPAWVSGGSRFELREKREEKGLYLCFALHDHGGMKSNPELLCMHTF